MKQILSILFLFVTLIFFSGSGYKGTLPDLEESLRKLNLKENRIIEPQAEILPLDKLTIPVSNTKKIDKVEERYKSNLVDIIRQLNRIKEVLEGDKSFKNFVAAANVFDLTTKNLLNEFDEERFYNTNKIISDINFDIGQIKNYWVEINKNVQYVSNYETQGVYSPVILNEQLNKLANALQYPIRDLNLYLGIRE